LLRLIGELGECRDGNGLSTGIDVAGIACEVEAEFGVLKPCMCSKVLVEGDWVYSGSLCSLSSLSLDLVALPLMASCDSYLIG